jgi:TRAP-type mannitol/chloroaromatic compound transport system permease small subunit
MKKLIEIIDKISDLIGKIFSSIIVIINILVIFEVILRRFLNSPTRWSFEIVIQLFGIYFMTLIGYGVLHNSHVSIDIFYEKFSKKLRAALDVLSYSLLFFPFWIIVLWRGYYFAKESWVIKEKSWTAFGCPLYYAKTIIPIAAILVLAQGLSVLMKKLLILFNKNNY